MERFLPIAFALSLLATAAYAANICPSGRPEGPPVLCSNDHKVPEAQLPQHQICAGSGINLQTGTTTATATTTAIASQTATATATGTYDSHTQTATASGTGTTSLTNAFIGSVTGTWMATATSTTARTVTLTATGTDTYTGSILSGTKTITGTVTHTLTATGTKTVSGTTAVTGTVTGSSGGTATASGIASSTQTVTASNTLTASATGTATASSTAFGTYSVTYTLQVSQTSTGTNVAGGVNGNITGTHSYSGTVSTTATSSVTDTLSGTGTTTTTGTVTGTVTETSTASCASLSTNPTVVSTNPATSDDLYDGSGWFLVHAGEGGHGLSALLTWSGSDDDSFGGTVRAAEAVKSMGTAFVSDFGLPIVWPSGMWRVQFDATVSSIASPTHVRVILYDYDGFSWTEIGWNHDWLLASTDATHYEFDIRLPEFYVINRLHHLAAWFFMFTDSTADVTVTVIDMQGGKVRIQSPVPAPLVAP